MRKLLTADFRRIMRKRSFWIAMALALAATVFGTVDGIDGAPQRGLKFTSSIMSVTGTADVTTLKKLYERELTPAVTPTPSPTPAPSPSPTPAPEAP